jgi:hypothetical protein
LKTQYPRTLGKDLVNIKLILSERGKGGNSTVADDCIAIVRKMANQARLTSEQHTA